MNTLRKNIMRRVYYAYVIRIVTHRNTIHMVLGIATMVVLSFFVSFHAVVQNFSQVRVGQALPYLLDALWKTEVWTLLTLGVIGLIFVSALRGNMPQRKHRRKFEFA